MTPARLHGTHPDAAAQQSLVFWLVKTVARHCLYPVIPNEPRLPPGALPGTPRVAGRMR